MIELEDEQKVTIFHLDNVCLSKLLSYLDWESINAILRTCRRLYTVSTDARSWNRSVLIKRTVYLLQNAWFGGWFESSKTNFKKYPNCKLSEFMREARVLHQNFIVLSVDKFGLVQQKYGPVSGKIFSYLRKCAIERVHDQPSCNWFMQKATLNFKLPNTTNAPKDLKLIMTLMFTKADREDIIEIEGGNEVVPAGNVEYNEAIKLKVWLDGLCMIYKSTDYYDPVNRFIRDYEDVFISEDLECLQPIVKTIQESLASTNVQITVEYLILLLKQIAFLDCSNDQGKFADVQQLKGVYFQQPKENYQPSFKVMKEWQQEIESHLIHDFQKQTEKLLHDSSNPCGGKEQITELIDCLVRISKTNIGFDLIDVAYHLSAKVGFDMLLTNEKVVRELLKLIDFTSVNGTWGLQAMQEQQCSWEIILFLKNNIPFKVSSTWSTMQHTFDQNLVYFNFNCLPNISISWSTEWNGNSSLSYEVLEPVTKILQHAIQKDQTNILILTDKEVAKLFLSMLKGVTKVAMQPKVQQDIKNPFITLFHINNQ